MKPKVTVTNPSKTETKQFRHIGYGIIYLEPGEKVTVEGSVKADGLLVSEVGEEKKEEPKKKKIKEGDE